MDPFGGPLEDPWRTFGGSLGDPWMTIGGPLGEQARTFAESSVCPPHWETSTLRVVLAGCLETRKAIQGHTVTGVYPGARRKFNIDSPGAGMAANPIQRFHFT